MSSKDAPPNLGDIQKDLKDFFQHKYGANVAFAQAEQEGTPAGPETEGEEPTDFRFEMRPEELEAYLDQYVIRQGEAKEILATKICTHFNRIRLDDDDDSVGNIKNNIIMIGGTGVGKTYLIKLIAKKLGVPFVKGDATKFSETGYVGGDVDDLVRSLVSEADGNIELAQYGIIYIDEIDKIAASGTVVGPDVSRTGVQRTLLKLMEETEVDLQAPHDLTSQMENALQFQRTGKIQKKKVNTRNILFIVSGAFQNLEDIINRRMNQQQIGFITADEPVETDDSEEPAWLKHVKSEDLIQYGFESEFVGRLPVIATLHPLNADDLYHILKNPNSTVVQAKKRDFRAYDITVEFDDDALELIAQRAFDEKTGARGLVGVCEKVLIKYEKKLPSTSISDFRVTREVVEHPEESLNVLLTQAAISRFEARFKEEYNLKLNLEPEAREALLKNASEQGVPADELGMEMFKDYSHGLKLLQRSELTVSKEAVENPSEYLNKLIKESYGQEEQEIE